MFPGFSGLVYHGQISTRGQDFRFIHIALVKNSEIIKLFWVKVYVKHWCPWCVEALHWLRHRNIPHEVVDVLADASAYDHMRKVSGQSLTPTLEMPNGEVLADFDTGQLSRFLTERGIFVP